ncbi:hypothetical protein IFM89_023487 [Coptis chinensis]|uniref:Pollen Ole e 1 allergen and extensin family protein n=1 Tax=Coptis chinensis TaxID=261450 RepID=A0A835M1C6_9MAGN|nr:hypothetical protein IFM89_023386 [Coptis chinensis]KAF9610599.1 hypothetical protein IFM89_023487 [Coptis chinensis]
MGLLNVCTGFNLGEFEGISEFQLSSATPSPVPAPSPNLPVRSLVAVQGIVYCKSCKYQGVNTLLGASPLTGAVVRLQCNNSKIPLREEAKTDKNGYFFLQPSKMITSYGAHKCKVFLVSSPVNSCQKPTDLHLGQNGAFLRYQKSQKPTPFALYSVGPFAFESTSCPH